MGAYDAIKEFGLRIPEDITIVGFNNQELIAAYLRPRCPPSGSHTTRDGAMGR